MVTALRTRGTALGVWLALLTTAAIAGAESDAEPKLCGDAAATPLLEEIRSQNALLDRRERKIEERERTLGELEFLVEERLAEIERIRGILESRIEAWEQQNGDRVRRLAKIYSEMPPGRAAPLIESLDVELATRILSRMKYKDSAAVMALLSPERALRVSRQVAHPLSFDPGDAQGGDS
jgi:flagellar motility protein MotE (MotC chaperone)